MTAIPSFDFRLINTPVGSLPTILRGPAKGPQLLFVPPLFEEMNRTRALLAEIGRRLVEHGIGSWLPDLPGTGDSDRLLTEVACHDWRSAVAALSNQIAASRGERVISFAVRGGALLDDAAGATLALRFVPVASGERLLREMLRTRLAADHERGASTTLADLDAHLATSTLEIGGYPLTPAMAAELRAATASPVAAGHTAALADGSGDRLFNGPPVWRQAEPAAAKGLAAEIAGWIAQCAAR